MPSISQDTIGLRELSGEEDGVPLERDVFYEPHYEPAWLSNESTSARLENDELCMKISKRVCSDVRHAVRDELESLQKEVRSLMERLGDFVDGTSTQGSRHSVICQSTCTSTSKISIKDLRDSSVPLRQSPSTTSSSPTIRENSKYSRPSVFEYQQEPVMRKAFSLARLRPNRSASCLSQSDSSASHVGREWTVHKDDDPLRTAVQNNDFNGLRRLLEGRSDPNTVFSQCGSKSKQYLDCSVVALAAMNEDIEMVQMLVEHHADINGTYGFIAGTLKMRWDGPAVFAPVPRGKLHVLEQMIALHADVHAEATNGSNLVWQSCYFGHEEILRYLLSLDVNPNVPALSQDQEGVEYTPLHIASLHGRDAIVEGLLAGSADPNPLRDCDGVRSSSPLSDAIYHCQPNIVRSLVSSGAKVNDPQHTSQNEILRSPSSRSSSRELDLGDVRYRNPLNLLFRDGFSNPVIVHAVALGLQKQEHQVKNLTIHDVCKFLSTPGKSQKAILDAIFKKRTIKYRNEDNIPEQIRTALIRRAQILPGGHRAAHLNIATTPHAWETMESWFKERKQWDSQDKVFLRCLAPQYHTHDGDHDMLAIVTYESLVPNIQNDLRVIRALTSTVDEAVFGIRSCQAIVQSTLTMNHKYQLYDVTIQAALHVWYLALTICSWDPPETSDLAKMIALSGMPFCMLQVLATMFELFAYWEKRWIRDSIRLLIDILADSAVALVFGIFGADALDWWPFRFFFGVSCCLKWVNFFASLTPYRRFGMPVLPILTTMKDILPFCGVFSFYILGIGHAILVMKISGTSWHESIYNTISFVFTAEIPLIELNEFDIFAEELVAKIFLILVGFLVPVTMMNTFIAALNGSYKQSIKSMEKLYQKRCAFCVLRLLAIQDTMSRFLVCARCFKHKNLRESLEPKLYLWYSLEVFDEDMDSGPAKAQKDAARKSIHGNG